jgi:hypothetical protein
MMHYEDKTENKRALWCDPILSSAFKGKGISCIHMIQVIFFGFHCLCDIGEMAIDSVQQKMKTVLRELMNVDETNLTRPYDNVT